MGWGGTTMNINEYHIHESHLKAPTNTNNARRKQILYCNCNLFRQNGPSPKITQLASHPSRKKTCPGKQQKNHNLDTIIDTSTKTTSNDAFLLGCALGHPHTEWRLSMRPKTFGSIGGCKERCGDAKSGASKVVTWKVS